MAFYLTPLRKFSKLDVKSRQDTDRLAEEFLVLTSKYGVFINPRHFKRGFILEKYEIDRIRPRLLNGASVFVNIRAFLGLYTVVSCGRVKEVITVKPNRYTLAFLKTNASLNCSNTIVISKAVASHKGIIELRIPPEEIAISTIASIIWWSSNYSYKFLVETDTLDNIVAEAGIDGTYAVKVDIERAEGIAFEGMKETLKRAKAVTMEIWPENLWIINEMRNIGYKLINIIDHHRYKNYVFVKSS
ncbi:MAG: FkbM family methyltransferase [Thermoprotei archaeon]|nr:FkbM family methyltransferase [Thermoprotei archaeon]